MARKTPAVDYTAIKKALANWANIVTGLVSIWERPDDARPPLPYISLTFVNPAIQSGIDELRPDDGENFIICGQRTAVVSIKTHYPDKYDTDSLEMASRIQAASMSPEFDQLLTAYGIAVNDSGDIIDISTELETGIENRHGLDMTITIVSSLSVSPGVIEHAEVSGAINNVLGNPAVEYDETIPPLPPSP